MGAFKEFLREEELNELSKKTLASYVSKATAQVSHHAAAGAKVPAGPQQAHAQKYHAGRLKKRMKGVKKAAANLKKVPKKPAPKKAPKPKKGFEYSKHGVASIASHAISSGVKHIVKAAVRKVIGKK